jgi:Cu/Ag efflux pump CusA
VKKIQFPRGYYVQFGGQFQAQEQATQTLIIAGAIAFLVISVLIYFAVKSIPV